jgi:hypothetical protein
MVPTDTVLKGNHPRNTWDKFCFISPSGGYFKVFNQSEGMVAILDIVQGHRTQFWERTIQELWHPKVFQKIKM